MYQFNQKCYIFLSQIVNVWDLDDMYEDDDSFVPLENDIPELKLLDSIHLDLEAGEIDKIDLDVRVRNSNTAKKKNKLPASTRKGKFGAEKHALVVLLRECSRAINRQKKVVEELSKREGGKNLSIC